MNLLKLFVRSVSLLGAALALSTATAAPTLLVTGGILTGANGVLINGTLYDVRFADGSCVALYSGCDSLADFTFTTQAAATAATQALIDTVFVDGAAGNFDSVPSLTFGCSSPVLCLVETPFSVDTLVRFSQASNSTIEANDNVNFNQDGRSADLSDEPQFTYALYSLSAVTSIPEPESYGLLGIGLLAAGIAARRRSPLR